VTDGLTQYNMIIGQGLINKLSIDIKGSNMSIYWDDASIPAWRDMDSTLNDAYLAYSPTHQPDQSTNGKASKMLDAEKRASKSQGDYRCRKTLNSFTEKKII
jgi:hypothetical protein